MTSLIFLNKRPQTNEASVIITDFLIDTYQLVFGDLVDMSRLFSIALLDDWIVLGRLGNEFTYHFKMVQHWPMTYINR